MLMVMMISLNRAVVVLSVMLGACMARISVGDARQLHTTTMYVTPKQAGTLGDAVLRVYNYTTTASESLPSVQSVNLYDDSKVDVECPIDLELTSTVNHWVACRIPGNLSGHYQVSVVLDDGSEVSSLESTVYISSDYNRQVLVKDALVGCAGDTVHFSSVGPSDWGDLSHAGHQINMKIGNHPVYLDSHSAVFRSGGEDDISQFHLRIPTGLEAGEHDLVVSFQGLHGSLGSGKVQIGYLHEERFVNRKPKVLVRPSITSVIHDLHTDLLTIYGSGFSLKSSQNKISLPNRECSIVASDYHQIVAKCAQTVITTSSPSASKNEDVGLSLKLTKTDGSVEIARIYNELEWPVANPAVTNFDHYQNESFVTTVAEDSQFVSFANAKYDFKLVCNHQNGRVVSAAECHLPEHLRQVQLKKNEKLPFQFRFKHHANAEHFSLYARVTFDQTNKTAQFSPVPASWFVHHRNLKLDSLSLAVNGIAALCRSKSNSHCQVETVNLKRHYVPPPLPPISTRNRGLLLLRENEPRQLATIPAGAVAFSAWQASNCPGTEADCVIPSGTRVIMDTNCEVGSLIVRGTLEWGPAFADESLTLRSGFIVVEDDGLFHIDAKASRVRTQTIYIKNNGKKHGVLDNRSFGTYSSSPEKSPRALVEGFPFFRTWTLLTANVNSGSSSITVEHQPFVIGWQVGDRIVIANTDLPGGSTIGPEVFTISAISGRTITLNAATNQNYLGDAAHRMQAEVINLSRNVVITGDDFDANKVGLHTVSHSRGGYMQVKHTYVSKCGQRGVLGKYCLHFHLKTSCPECQFIGNAIEDSNQRGIVVHGTHRSTVDSNVLFKVRGANLYVEDGNEMDNIFSSNVGICDQQYGSQGKGCIAAGTDNDQSDDIQQSGIWALSMSNNFIDNRMVNQYNAFFTQVSAFGLGKGAASGHVCTVYGAMGEFRGNVQHSSWRFGFYLDNNWPRQLARSVDTNGLVIDIGSCFRNNPTQPCSCDEFKADGTDNGQVGVVSDGIDFGNLFVGQYDLGDVQYLRYYSHCNIHNLYWKTTKNFADGQTSHIKDSIFGCPNGIPGYSNYAVTNIAGPGGLGAFIIENTKFIGRAGEGSISANQHCMIGRTGGGCNPEYVLVDVDFSELDASSMWIRFGLSGGNDRLPMFTTFDQSLGGVVSVASEFMTHLLAIQDSSGQKVCQRSGDVNLAGRMDNGIICTNQLRRLQIWTDGAGGTINTPNGGSLALDAFETQGGKGFATAVVVDANNLMTYTLNGIDQANSVIEFSDTTFGSKFNKPDSIELVINGGSCGTVTSQHDRSYIGPRGPLVAGKGACRNLATMPPISPTPPPTLPPVQTVPTPAPTDGSGQCTPENGDPWSTSAFRPCCASLRDCLNDWDGDGRWYYLCLPSCSTTPTQPPTEPPSPPIVTQPTFPPISAPECTPLDRDPWSTGSNVQCCNTLETCLRDWKGDGNYHYLCKTSCTQSAPNCTLSGGNMDVEEKPCCASDDVGCLGDWNSDGNEFHMCVRSCATGVTSTPKASDPERYGGNSSATAVILGSVFGLAAIVVAISVFIIRRKRQRRQHQRVEDKLDAPGHRHQPQHKNQGPPMFKLY